jgi:hypothetical protein
MSESGQHMPKDWGEQGQGSLAWNDYLVRKSWR